MGIIARSLRTAWRVVIVLPQIRVALLAVAILLRIFGDIRANDKWISRAQVNDLILSLDSKTLSERSRAEGSLLELGPDVLPLLPSPDLIESVSARESVRRIRPQLERRAARESSAASHVILNGELTLGEILQQIEHQTKNQVAVDRDQLELKERRLSVQWDKKTFWECLDDLCQRGPFRWQLAKDEAAIWISRSDSGQSKPLAVNRSGPFRIAIESVERRAIVGDERQKIVRISGRLAVEPRLRPLFLSVIAIGLKAVADDERPLAPWNPDAKYEIPVGDGGREVSLQWDYRLPAELKIKSVSIRGQLHCQIAAATERVIFDQKSQTRGAIRRRGGVTVRLRQIAFTATEDNKLDGEIGISVSYDNGGPAFESHRTWILHNAAYLETKAGVRTSFTDFDTTQQGDGAIALDYRWKKIAAPVDQYLFVYEAPSLIIDVPVEVHLGAISVGE